MSRKSLTILAVAAVVFAVFMAITPMLAHAGDKMITAKADSVTVLNDRNGNEYVRIIITETRTLEGMEYAKGIPVMAFGDLVERAKTLKAGDEFTAVVSTREFQGRESYTLMALN